MERIRLGRVAAAVEKRGVRGTARSGVKILWQALYQDEVSTWYEVPLDHARPRVPLREGELVRAVDAADFASFNAIGSQSAAVAHERRCAGGEPWVLLVDGEPAFCCWLYAGRSPVNSMPGEWLRVPDGTRTLEDSITAPGFRGRGLAGGVWTALFDGLEAEGVRSVITNVLDSNVPSTRAVLKVGFAPVASMRYRRIGPRSRQVVTALAGGVGPPIVEDLHGRTFWRRIFTTSSD